VSSTAANDGVDRGGRDGRDHPVTPVALVAAELGLLAVALATTATFARLFEGWDFLRSLAVPVTAAWLVSVALRRLRVGPGVATATSLGIAVLVLTWQFAPETTAWGLPTGDTLAAGVDLVRGSFGDFADQVAPVPASDGFLLTLGAVLWVFVTFADTSALRYRAPVQAVIPYLATVVASGVLARDAARVGSTAVFALGLAVYAVTQRALVASTARWRHGDARSGVRAVALGASALAVAVLVVGVALAPLLPGDDEAVVDLRTLGRGEGPRTVVSPFVGVTSLLGERSDEVVFTVGADEASYWRLTALEQYDAERSIWTSRGTYRSADGDLGETVAGRPLTQEVRIATLGGLWLPAAFQAVDVTGDVAVGVDPRSSSLIARDDSATPGTTYRVTSVLRVVDPAALATAPVVPTDPTTVAADGVSDDVRRTAGAVVAGSDGPYQQALALQDWLRGPGATYDTAVDYRGEIDPVAAFLRERRGFCQQFASAYALMARAVGLPSRVAVGFTPGDRLVDDPTRFVVRGRHAHAWPEVQLPGVGWVAFEPTPGRGDPQGTGWTGVGAAQAEPPATQAATTSTTSTTTPDRPTTPPDTPAELDASAESTPPAAGTGDRGAGTGGTRWAALSVLSALALGAIATLILRRWRRSSRRRRAREDPGVGPIAVAWDDVTRSCVHRGLSIRSDETPLEFARRVSTDPGCADIAHDVESLARLETVRRFAPDGGTPDDGELAGEIARHVVAAIDAGLGARQRVLERVR
jgi:hypothetical protein